MGYAESRKPTCQCLDQSVFVDSLVIVLTVLASIAISCWNIIALDIVIVPQSVVLQLHNSNDSSGSDSPSNFTSNTTVGGEGGDEQPEYKEVDEDVQDVLQSVLLFVNIGITAVFVIEILLKVLTLRMSFCTKPSQLFDGFVVSLCAAFQAVFYFISIPDIYYCCSYLIVVRLWRICSVCNIRAQRMKEMMEEDIEHRITDHLKTRQRCIILENISMQQESRIKGLREENRRITEYHRKTDASMASLEISDKQLSCEDIRNNNNMHSTTRRSRNSSHHKSCEELRDVESSKNRGSDRDTNSLYAKANPKPRWRRSSTNEYLERRMSLHTELDAYSQTSAFPQPASMTNFFSPPPENDNNYNKDSTSLSPSVDYLNDSHDEIDRGKLDETSIKSSAGSDSSSCVNLRKHRFKRQNSCPEYMFTQRMKISKYESMLIEDHRVSDTFVHGNDNDGFSPDDGIPMSILGVYDDAKTYRSQDGIPTTDL